MGITVMLLWVIPRFRTVSSPVALNVSGVFDLLHRKQREKLLVVSSGVKDLTMIIAPRDYVIQTTLDFGARFPGHRGADTNPAEVRRQPFLDAKTLV
jgi:hypothetical protein